MLGITGRSGTGKTTALKYMRGKGVDIIDGDEISHRLYAAGTQVVDRIVKCFGKRVLNSDGSVNRALLADIVFSDPEKLESLNAITHKYILSEIEKEIAQSKASLVAVEGSALIESGFWQRCDIRLAFVSDSSAARIVMRDKITEYEAKKRLEAQKDDDYYTKTADRVIVNNGSIKHLHSEVDAFLKDVEKGVL